MEKEPVDNINHRLDAGPPSPEKQIVLVKVTVTFDQIKKFFRRVFKC